MRSENHINSSENQQIKEKIRRIKRCSNYLARSRTREKKLLNYEIDRMKEELKVFDDLKSEVDYLKNKFEKLYNSRIVDKELNLKT